jgi:hypothetical protein
MSIKNRDNGINEILTSPKGGYPAVATVELVVIKYNTTP